MKHLSRDNIEVIANRVKRLSQTPSFTTTQLSIQRSNMR